MGETGEKNAGARPTEPTSVLIAKRVNLYIFSRSPRFSLATFVIRNTTLFQRMFNSRKMDVITIRHADEIAQALAEKLGTDGSKKIGTLWIDSHGVYKKGVSLLVFGKDTIDYKNIFQPEIVKNFFALQPYCDSATKIVIGACYAGSAFVRPGNQWLIESKMYGDSLMVAMGTIFPRSSIYATESWVMTTPILFGHSWALAGHPLEKRCWDEIYRPVWKSMGNWYRYSLSSGTIEKVNTVYLDRNGALKINPVDYLDAGNHRRNMESNLKKLGPNRYHVYKK